MATSLACTPARTSSPATATDAIEAFKAGRVDVLIASIGTLGTGVDGLQHVCHNMVVASLPWTAADWRQLIARLARSGQQHTVRVTVPTTYIDLSGADAGRWSYCDWRAAILTRKAAADGCRHGWPAAR